MRIMLLGTGSADGWPNPFCECDSCGTERRAGRSRRPASALVDDVLLIDCGPAATQAASAGGRSLRSVEHVLITHGHPDHLDPAFLLARHWARTTCPLHVWAPAQAVDRCRDWIGPQDAVRLHVIAAGDRALLPTASGDYVLRVLAAEHSSGNGDSLASEAVLFDLTASDGRRLLYATDTGPLPAATVAQVGGAVDVLILDETFGDNHAHGTGHLDLVSFPEVLDTLRLAGVVGASTQVVATHLSHHNPATPALRDRLAEHGVLVLEDLDIIETGRSPARRLLVLGGARSGKSTHAERVAAQWSGTVTYVATGGQRAEDPDWAERVAEHRSRRPADWSTIETLDIAGVLDSAHSGSVVLVDCLTLWVTGLLDRANAWERIDRGEAAEVQSTVMLAVHALVEATRASRADVILVSNEVGSGVVPATSSGRLFRDLMGRVNAQVAGACDTATFVIAGRSIALQEMGTR